MSMQILFEFLPAFTGIFSAGASIASLISAIIIHQSKKKEKDYIKDVSALSEEEINLHTLFYVKQKCIIDNSVDDLFEQTNKFIFENAEKCLFIEGNPGSGKTTFCLNYLAYFRKIHKKLSDRIYFISLVAPKEQQERLFRSIPENCILLLDGLDEKHPYNINKLSQILLDENVAIKCSKIIITSRSISYSDAKCILQLESKCSSSGTKLCVTDHEKKSPCSHGIKKISIAPFSNTEIEKYISKRYNRLTPSLCKTLSKEITAIIPKLSSIPLTLSSNIILALLDSNKNVLNVVKFVIESILQKKSTEETNVYKTLKIYKEISIQMSKTGKNYISNSDMNKISSSPDLHEDMNNILILLEKKDSGFRFIDEKLRDVFLFKDNSSISESEISKNNRSKILK